MNKEIKITEMICFKILLDFIMSISCIGCTSNKTPSNEIVESSINTKDDSITVEYNDNFSWNISGNGSCQRPVNLAIQSPVKMTNFSPIKKANTSDDFQ